MSKVKIYEGHQVPAGATKFLACGDKMQTHSFYRLNQLSAVPFSEVYCNNLKVWIRQVRTDHYNEAVELPEESGAPEFPFKELSVYQETESEPVEWAPNVGDWYRIAESTKHLKISYPPGVEVKIYSMFVDDRGCTLFSFVDKIGKVGGIGVADTFAPLKTEAEKKRDSFDNAVFKELYKIELDLDCIGDRKRKEKAIANILFKAGFTEPKGDK